MQVCTAVRYEAASLQALLDVNGLSHVSQLLQWLSLASAHQSLGNREHDDISGQQTDVESGLDERRRSGRFASTSEGAVVSKFAPFLTLL